jgi:WD40 repeat protein
LALSPDGRTLAAGSADKVELWDTAGGGKVRTLSGHTEEVYTAAFSPNGRNIVSGSSDKSIKIWDAATGREIRTLSGHAARVKGVSYSPDGKAIFSVASDSYIKVWSVDGGEPESHHSGDGAILSIIYDPQGRRVFTGSIRGSITEWKAVE